MVIELLLFPTVELDLVWPGRAFAGFEQRLEAQQKDRPFGAAVVHELHRLLPALMFEENNGPVTVLCQIEADLGAEPFFRAVNHLPQNALAGLQFENLHVEAAFAKAELQLAADLAFSLSVARPPAGKPRNGGQCVIDIVQRRRFDSNLMQNVRHVRFSVPCC